MAGDWLYGPVMITHYSDVTMSALASLITDISPTVCSTICWDLHQNKHQSSASLALVSDGFPSQRATAVAVLSRWRLSVAICARMFYDTFVFNFGFYLLWWCIYYQWCLYFYQKDFMVMYSCIFTYECVFYYVLGQRWPNKRSEISNAENVSVWWRHDDNEYSKAVNDVKHRSDILSTQPSWLIF